jgi:magnesium transporter
MQALDTTEIYRDILSGLLDVYLSSVSNRMNEIMKVLTIISTIFIPLTFLAGIYGMNFSNMPELGWRWGYFALLGVMAVLALLMLLFFKRKKWL